VPSKGICQLKSTIKRSSWRSRSKKLVSCRWNWQGREKSLKLGMGSFKRTKTLCKRRRGCWTLDWAEAWIRPNRSA
jgi:hypothetical protein